MLCNHFLSDANSDTQRVVHIFPMTSFINSSIVSDEDDISHTNDNEDEFKYINASCGSAPLYKMNDGSKQPVSYAALYRYRGKDMKDLNRYEYCAVVRVADRETADKSPKKSTAGLRQKSKAFEFGTGLGIEKNHHQVLRSKQCTPKFKRSPPAHPGPKPQPQSQPLVVESKTLVVESKKKYESDLVSWRKRADRFARYYLIMFRPEDVLYEDGQVCSYAYNYETFVEFYEQLICSHRASDKFRLDQIHRVFYSWRVNRERREMLAVYRGRNRTLWSNEEKEAAKSYFGCGNCKPIEGDDGMDYTTSVMNDLLTQKQQTDARKHISHSKQLLDTLGMLDNNFSPRRESAGRESVPNASTLPFNTDLDSSKRITKCIKEVEEDGSSQYWRARDMNEKVDKFIESQKLSSDKDVAVDIVRGHFDAIRTGRAEASDYDAPLLFISGGPGNGKSKLVETFDGMASAMKVGKQMKCAYMGSAAVNIGGCTILKSWDIPIFNDGDRKEFGTWDPGKLLALKRVFDNDIHSMCCVVVDEVSTLQPYMVACLSARMQEMFKRYDKPFGGRMVIFIGDFQQKPPTAGGMANTLPGSVMEQMERNGLPPTEREARRLGPAQIGGYLFSKFRHIKLTRQHRSEDPTHMKVIEKMSKTGIITVGDLKNYKKLSSEDLASDDFRFATIIVTGNDERRQINAWQAGRWAKFHGVNIVRWARSRREQTWKNRPRKEENIAHAMHNSCFWELFIPGAKGYLNTYGINADNGLANGTEIKYHSLSFNDRDIESQFQQKLQRARPGDTVTIDSSPSAINVELFGDFNEDTSSVTAEKVVMRKKWLEAGMGSITNDGHVVIPISLHDGKRIQYKTTYVPGCFRVEAEQWYGELQIEMKDYFPIEPAFSITVDKAQVRQLVTLFIPSYIMVLIIMSDK